MRDPFTHPFFSADDLGLAIPESDHAVSVCLPLWEHVVGYEEGDESIVDTMECGYPRFLVHPLVAELFLAAQKEFARKDEVALVFPSLSAAWRCADYVKKRVGASCRLESYSWGDLTAVLLPEEAYETAWQYWQHAGEIVSSRMAESALTDAALDNHDTRTGNEATTTIRSRLAEDYSGVDPADVYLFSSGMAAIFAVHRILTDHSPGLPTIQIEFPYRDTFKLQEQFGEGGIADFSTTLSGGLDEVCHFFQKGNRAAAVYTEVPSNPLLRTANLVEISPILRENDVPLVIDDAVVTGQNVAPFRFADVVTTSLTKSFSGGGDVAGGAVILHRDSPFYEILKTNLPDAEAASPLFVRDATVLEMNSRHFAERTAGYNANAMALVDLLEGHPLVEKIWHPSVENSTNYDALKKDKGGYGGLLSIQLKGGQSASAKFYDALELSKGPSFGTNFSLICPYVLLAHYHELDWAKKRGVDPNLIRIWTGLEDSDELLKRFEMALG